jgi:hypothetical protein
LGGKCRGKMGTGTGQARVSLMMGKRLVELGVVEVQAIPHFSCGDTAQ